MTFGTAFFRECHGLKCIKGDQKMERWVVRGPVFPLLLGGRRWNIVGRGPVSSQKAEQAASWIALKGLGP